MQEISKGKQALKITLKTASILTVAFILFIMIFTLVSVFTVDKNNRSIFGIKFYIVQSDSMSKSDNNVHLDVHFNAGDIILVKQVKDASTLKEGDIISFISPNPESRGKTITHMIREIKKDSKGNIIGFVTYGTHTGVNDEELVEPSYILGKYTGKLPKMGNFFAFVKSTPGYIVCILLPFVLLILYNGANIVELFKKYRKEQKLALDAERTEIQAEKTKAEEMLKEIEALKAELEKQKQNSENKD